MEMRIVATILPLNDDGSRAVVRSYKTFRSVSRKWHPTPIDFLEGPHNRFLKNNAIWS